MPGRACTFLALVCGSLAARGGGLYAQNQPETSIAGQVEVARLVDLAAQRLGIAVDYDAANLKAAGTVTLRESSALSDLELWSLVNRVLSARGLTSVRVPGGFSIVKIADAPALAQPESATERGPPAGYRSIMYRPQHQPAKVLAELAAKVISKTGGSVIAAGDDRLLLLSDLAPQVERALELFRAVDVPGPAATIEELRLTNLSAMALVTLVNQVVAKLQLVSGERPIGEVLPGAEGAVFIVAPANRLAYWRDLIASLDRREPVRTESYQPRVFAAKEVGRLIEQAVKSPGSTVPSPEDRWKLVTDELTGSLIITATPAQHERIRAMLERLDSAPMAAQRPVRSFVIRNRPVREILAILEQLVDTGVLAAEPAAAAPTPTVPGTSPWPPPASPTVATQPGPGAAATPAAPAGPGTSTAMPAAPQVPAVTSLPRPPNEPTPGQHDRQLPDLVLSVDEGTNTLIAMGEPRLLSQIETLLQTLDVRQAQVMLEVLIVSLSDSQTLDLGVEIEALGQTDDVRSRIASLFGLGTRDSAGNRIGGDGLGLTGVVLNPGDFSIILRALQTLNKGRSLSMPKMLVTNNQQAMLDSVLEQPFASTNASNTVTTTSFGGTKPAGTQITLKPQIAEGDHLLLDYNISLSAFVGAAANASLPPPRQENKVQSAASLPDGHTVVVGGIELTTEGRGTNQVPGLARIPIIGEVFKSRSNTNSRSRFYVFIRVNILRHGSFEDLKYLSEVAAGPGQGAIDDGWPVVEPRVIR